jgi:hypothetical protein
MICVWDENTYKVQKVFPSHTVDRLLWLGRLIASRLPLPVLKGFPLHECLSLESRL